MGKKKMIIKKLFECLLSYFKKLLIAVFFDPNGKGNF